MAWASVPKDTLRARSEVASAPLSPQPVAEPHELLVAGDVDQLQVSCRQPTRKQRRSTTECDRRDADKNLVQQATVGELPTSSPPPTSQTFLSPAACVISW